MSAIKWVEIITEASSEDVYKRQILYNGPFLLKSLTAKSSIELTKNENYWDKKNVHFDSIKFSYSDGSDLESIERSFSDGALSIARVFPTSSNYASVEKKYKDNIFYTEPGASTSVIGVNIDRQSYKFSAKKTDCLLYTSNWYTSGKSTLVLSY